MVCYTEIKKVKVIAERRYRNITKMVLSVLKESGITNGQVTVTTLHTTCALLKQEKESGLVKDLFKCLEKIAPEDCYYQHDDFSIRTENCSPEERKNAAAHIKTSFLPSTVSVLVGGGVPPLGQWQSILFFDFDPERRPSRTLKIQVLGEKGESRKDGG